KSGTVVPDREIAGLATRLDMPLRAALDTAHDSLYVANRGSNGSNNEITVFEPASTFSGNRAPSRFIPLQTTSIRPGVAIDWMHDIMYVSGGGANDNEVRVYTSASTLNSTTTPARTFTF